MKTTTIRELVREDLDRAFAVLKELREQLDPQTFTARLQRQSEFGYRLYGAFDGTELVGLLGMRPVETMARGRHLHVDDLVVTEKRRGNAIGQELMGFAEKIRSRKSAHRCFPGQPPGGHALL
jgi:hypothetical protein